MQARDLTRHDPNDRAAGSRPRMFAVVFEAGEEPVSGLRSFAEDAGVDAAQLTAIGGFERATVGWFDLEAQDYRRIEIEEQVELLSLVGDVTLAEQADDQPRVHAHVVLGRADGSTVGGHLLEARVRPTLEVVVTDAPATLRRRHDPATGLALIDPQPGSTAPGWTNR